MHPKVEVAEHRVSIPSSAAANHAVPTATVKAPIAPTTPPSVAPTMSIEAVVQNPIAAAHILQKTPARAYAQ